MEVRYTSIYKVHGISALPEGAEQARLVEHREFGLTAVLKADPRPDMAAVIRSQAVGRLAMSGLVGPRYEGSLKERIENAEKEARLQLETKLGKEGVFAVFGFEEDMPTPEFKRRRDTDEFGLSMDNIGQDVFREACGVRAKKVLSALALVLPDNVDVSFEPIADVVFLVDPSDDKPVYLISINMSGSVSIHQPISSEQLQEAASLSASLLSRDDLGRVDRLYATSMDRRLDKLTAFVAVWAAFEMLIDQAFRSRSTKQPTPPGEPSPGRPPSLRDRFVDMIRRFRPDHEAEDAETFRRLQHVRNRLQHAFELPDGPLPVGDAQKLLRKHLKAYLQA